MEVVLRAWKCTVQSIMIKCIWMKMSELEQKQIILAEFKAVFQTGKIFILE